MLVGSSPLLSLLFVAVFPFSCRLNGFFVLGQDTEQIIWIISICLGLEAQRVNHFCGIHYSYNLFRCT